MTTPTTRNDNRSTLFTPAQTRDPQGKPQYRRHDRVLRRKLSEIRPAPENDDIYGAIHPDDPEIVALADRIQPHGLCEPIVVSADGYILSGHRRYAAAKRLSLKSLPCRVESIRRSDDLDPDFDPDGETIAHSFARSMRDDFGIYDIHPIKVALTSEQVEEYELLPVVTAKTGSSNYDEFVDRYGEDVFELEALDPDDLQTILTEAIESVIDVDMYNAEVDEEAKDAAFLDGVRNTVHEALKSMNWEQGE